MESMSKCYGFHTTLQMHPAYHASLDLQEKLVSTKRAYLSLRGALTDVEMFAMHKIKCEDEAFVPTPSSAENMRRLRALLANHSEWTKPDSTVASTVVQLCAAVQVQLLSAIHTIDELLESRTFLFV